METFYFTQGDTGIPLECRIADKNGNIDLSDKTATLTIWNLHSSVKVIDAASCDPDPDQAVNKGVLRYNWTPQDAIDMVRGMYEARFSVIYSGGAVVSFPRGNFGDDYFSIIVT